MMLADIHFVGYLNHGVTLIGFQESCSYREFVIILLKLAIKVAILVKTVNIA